MLRVSRPHRPLQCLLLLKVTFRASPFTPKRAVIKSETGQEVNLEQYKKHPITVSSPIVPSSPARRTVQVRMETEDAKQRECEVEEAERAKHRKEEEEGTRKDQRRRRREGA